MRLYEFRSVLLVCQRFFADGLGDTGMCVEFNRFDECVGLLVLVLRCLFRLVRVLGRFSLFDA